MKIISAEFVTSVYSRLQWLSDGRPEIAFLGRSNVGKSSLINSLLLRKGLARTSNTPGRTQSINFFLINDSFYFTDLPGYGYARVSKTKRQGWGKMAEEYLAERSELALCIQLIDARHEPTSLDVELNDWLVFNNKPHLIVATKADKISRNELQRSLDRAGKALPGAKPLGFSAITKQGREPVWAEINEALKIYST
ncbi:MAG: ribosome biogenesis GTP-binding protein YihA/YsxC [Pyrinomonadaceae bacterium]